MVQGQKAWIDQLSFKHAFVAEALLMLMLGSVQALALAYPIEGIFTSALQIAGLGLFIHFINKSERIYWMSWLYAVTWLSGSVAWLFVALHVYGHLPSGLSVVAIVLLCGGLATYYSCAIWVYGALVRKIPAWLGILVLAASWTMAEMARAQWFTGFPWAAIGYAHVNSYLSYAAPMAGVYGVGFAAVSMSGVLVWALKHQDVKVKVMVLAALVGLLVPISRSANKAEQTVSFQLLQGNIPQDLKYASGKNEAIDWYKTELINSQADVTVLPETAIPYFKAEMPQEYWDEIEQKFDGKKQAAIIGIPTGNQNHGYGNSAIALGMNEGPMQYNKFHLVPFGEYMPESVKSLNRWVDFGMTDFSRGDARPQPFIWKNNALSVNICYEDVFGEEIAKRFVMMNAPPPDVLINISNLGWFGNNYVVDQHLNMARMRSLEFNRPSVRATNSGGTAIINAQGKIESKLTPYTRGVLHGTVQISEHGITPYAYWAGHWGLKPLWLWCLAIWGLAYWPYKRSSQG